MSFLKIEAMHGVVLRLTLVVNSELSCTKSLDFTSLDRRIIIGLFCIGSTKKMVSRCLLCCLLHYLYCGGEDRIRENLSGTLESYRV